MTLTNTIDACAGKLLRGGSVALLLAVFVLLSLNVFTFSGIFFSSSNGGILNTGSTSAGDAAGDTLIGIENLIGSGNNDTLIAAAGARIDGGAGSDTAIVTHLGGGSVSMATIASLLSNVEALSIRSDGYNTQTTFTAADIQHIVNSGAASSLTVLADSGDSFNFSPTGGETLNTTDLGNGSYDYTISSSGSTIATVHWQVA